MPFCPNCANELEASESEESCNTCGAFFGAGSTLKPTENQLFKPSVRKIEPLTTEGKIVKGVIATPLLLIGAFFLFVAINMGSNGSWAVIPAVICLGAGVAIGITRGKAAKIISVIAGIFVLLVLWGLVQIIGYAIR
jgi:hypothetical protein